MGLGSRVLIHSMNRSTYAVTYNSLDSVLYLSMSMMAATVVFMLSSQVCSTGLSGSTSASATASWICSVSVGLHVGLCCSCMIHFGPCAQILDACNEECEMPLVNRSAGLSADGQ